MEDIATSAVENGNFGKVWDDTFHQVYIHVHMVYAGFVLQIGTI